MTQCVEIQGEVKAIRPCGDDEFVVVLRAPGGLGRSDSQLEVRNLEIAVREYQKVLRQVRTGVQRELGAPSEMPQNVLRWALGLLESVDERVAQLDLTIS